ncbi:MAG TPA: HAD family hydrolase [Terriglobales bacterium]|nr:HAD family hydrolase [Terriglobales bacterium]
MRFRVLASDYDGTLACEGKVAAGTIAALKRMRASGRKLILVTGRELPELRDLFSSLDLFDLVVVENGALLHFPATGENRLLGAKADKSFIRHMAHHGVPVSVGRSVVATIRPYDALVLKVIQEFSFPLRVIYNKEAVMVLPIGVSKATGLAAALAELSLLESDVVGIGDAENDHAFLSQCGLSVAVANAIPSLKQRVDQVTLGEDGSGVVEIIDQILKTDIPLLKTNLP